MLHAIRWPDLELTPPFHQPLPLPHSIPSVHYEAIDFVALRLKKNILFVFNFFFVFKGDLVRMCDMLDEERRKGHGERSSSFRFGVCVSVLGESRGL